jgi:hypothetical protein
VEAEELKTEQEALVVAVVEMEPVETETVVE